MITPKKPPYSSSEKDPTHDLEVVPERYVLSDTWGEYLRCRRCWRVFYRREDADKVECEPKGGR